MGIIPAGAGLTVCDGLDHIDNWDHPRGCGAHLHAREIIIQLQGSSPRVRGSHRLSTIFGRYLGIIPAGAGLTRHNKKACHNLRDHPRGCGAHWMTALKKGM